MKFAPLLIPWKRRMETFAVLQWMICATIMGLVSIIGLAYILYSSMLRPIGLLYLAWYIYDYRTPDTGGYNIDFIRRWKIWTHYKNFFPVTMVKTADLNPDNSYIFGHHPHGIAGFGAFSSFGTSASSFKQFFPNIVPKLCVLSLFFKIPISREYLMCCGILPCSKECIGSIIKHKGNAAIIVVGGAAEALVSDPNTHTLVLKNRKGFIKLALHNGSSLVPVYSFGENDVYKTFTFKEDSWMYIFQMKFKKYTGVSTPLFHGRGIFQYSFGLIPFRKPIFVVVGAPIKVEKNECPTQQQVDDLQTTYMNNLSDLFEEHKSNYGLDKEQHLSFI